MGGGLCKKGVTSILTFETGESTDTGTYPSSVGGRSSYMSDNIVLLSTDFKGEVKRTLRIIKARASQHDPGVHALEISEKGLRILPARRRSCMLIGPWTHAGDRCTA